MNADHWTCLFVQAPACDGGTQFVRVLHGETVDQARARVGGVVVLYESDIDRLEKEVGHSVDAEDVRDLLGLEF